MLREFARSGAEAGARLARVAGAPTSPNRLLRLQRQTPEPDRPTPRVLSVHDLALPRGCRYTTLLVDLETHQPVDLLEGRDAQTLAAWLAERGGIEILVRDRSEAYAEDACQGAPAACQAADRFHLAQYASQALDEVLRSRRRRLEFAADSASSLPPVVPTAPERPLRGRRGQRAERRTERRARWEHESGRRPGRWLPAWRD